MSVLNPLCSPLSPYSCPKSHVFVISCVVSLSACSLRDAAVDGEGCDRENNADTAPSSVMAPQAPCFSRFLCSASLSFIKGHDGLHPLILTKQETLTSPHFSSSLFSRPFLSLSSDHVTICMRAAYYHCFVHVCQKIGAVWYKGSAVAEVPSITIKTVVSDSL